MKPGLDFPRENLSLDAIAFLPMVKKWRLNCFAPKIKSLSQKKTSTVFHTLKKKLQKFLENFLRKKFLIYQIQNNVRGYPLIKLTKIQHLDDI